MKPFRQPAKQFHKLKFWHRYLRSRRQHAIPTPVDRLDAAWRTLAATEDYRLHSDYLLRGATHNGYDRKPLPPLAQLFDYVEAGLYPPPELLLTLWEAWFGYMQAEGKLENAFFGPPVPKAGNYAARALAARKKVGVRIALYDGIKASKSKKAIARDLKSEYGTSFETALRTQPLEFDWADYNSKPEK